MNNKRRRILFIISFIILCALSVFIFCSNEAKKQDMKKFLTLYGNVEIRQVDLGFRVEGRILKMFKEEGDYVKKGALLASLDDIKYTAQYEKSVENIAMQQSLADDAKKVYERNLPLCKDGTTSLQACDNYESMKNSSTASLNAAIKESKVAKDNLDNTKIYAPNSGIITTRIKEEGAVVNANNPVYTLSLSEPVWIRTYVNEKDLGNITYGMKATILTDSTDPNTGKKREYDGWIGYISPVAEFTPKTVQTTDLRTDLVYRIRIYVFDVDNYLRLGMPTTIRINIANPTINKNLKIKNNGK